MKVRAHLQKMCRGEAPFFNAMSRLRNGFFLYSRRGSRAISEDFIARSNIYLELLLCKMHLKRVRENNRCSSGGWHKRKDILNCQKSEFSLY